MRFNFLSYTIIGLLFLVVLCPVESRAAEELRGIWVECEGSNDTLSSKEKIDEMLKRVSELNLNALFVQVYRGNRCWYDSDITDKTPFLRIKKKDQIDLLAYIIKEAHKRNIQVHAWLNIFRIARNLKCRMIKELGKEIINVDSKGRSLLEYKNFKVPDPDGKYYTLGTHGYWLDPGNLEVQGYLLRLIKEVLKKYPDLDGLHMDMIRNPYCLPYSPGSRFPGSPSFGYGKESVDRFKKKTNLNPFTMDLNTKNTQTWDEFRRDQITDFVRKVYRACRTINPRLNVSAAVLSWADRAYLSAFQDWRRWLEEKLIDSLLIMNYSKDTRFARYLSRQAISASLGRHIYMGLGVYLLLKDHETKEIVEQIDDVRSIDGQGIVLFSYDAMLKNKKLFSRLKLKSFPNKVSPTTMKWK